MKKFSLVLMILGSIIFLTAVQAQQKQRIKSRLALRQPPMRKFSNTSNQN